MVILECILVIINNYIKGSDGNGEIIWLFKGISQIMIILVQKKLKIINYMVEFIIILKILQYIISIKLFW